MISFVIGVVVGAAVAIYRVEVMEYATKAYEAVKAKVSK